MVGRPPTPLGTFGRVTFVTQPSGNVQARVRFRDYDGRPRQVSKVASSRAGAERLLKQALVDRQVPADAGVITGATRVDELVAVWLAEDHGWSSGTERTYRAIVASQVLPALGALRVREVTAGLVARVLAAIVARSGPGAAKTTRSALSGMFRIAVRDGALAANPVRDAGARLTSASKGRKRPRALSPDEEGRLVGLVRAHPRAHELDLADLVDWMLATGCRIGEALAARVGTNADGRPLLDLEAGTWEVDGTVVRRPGAGLEIQPRTKTAAGWRIIALPAYATELIRPRAQHLGPVFTVPVLGTLRDPSNVANELRRLFDSLECEDCDHNGHQLGVDGRVRLGERGQPLRCDRGPWSWITSHTFRKTVATKLDMAGFSARQAADHLGHANPSMTLDVYFGRHVASSAAAAALDRRQP